jgi:hypothetical protein
MRKIRATTPIKKEIRVKHIRNTIERMPRMRKSRNATPAALRIKYITCNTITPPLTI